ncbi:PhnA domain-containing protein [Marinifilum sp.]|uniref:PhnA domain-containing protein n=1 Tax=Marinifilum sp. TaxID=2033137 RepID=UPI003BAB0287
MNIEKELLTRSAICELCGSEDKLSPYEVAPSNGSIDEHILVCATCKEQVEDKDKMDANHWRCLNDSMWSTIPAVQVMAWRMLNRLKTEGWPQDLLDMLYLDEETTAWAKATGEDEDEEDKVKHIDSNGVELQPGDSVVLIKDLKVSGAGFTAKRGAAVRRISLVADDPTHIEGRVEGQQIYILTKYVKKI